jgi:hypothetical protein
MPKKSQINEYSDIDIVEEAILAQLIWQERTLPIFQTHYKGLLGIWT